MDYRNLKEANEIDFAIKYIVEIRIKFVDEIREKEKKLGKGVITDVANSLTSGIVELEDEIIKNLKKRLEEL